MKEEKTHLCFSLMMRFQRPSFGTSAPSIIPSGQLDSTRFKRLSFRSRRRVQDGKSHEQPNGVVRHILLEMHNYLQYHRLSRPESLYIHCFKPKSEYPGIYLQTPPARCIFGRLRVAFQIF